MIKKSDYPILEFDDSSKAVIDPFEIGKNNKEFNYDRLVITFFSEVVDRLLEEGKISEYRFMKQENPYFVYRFNDSDVLLVLGQVGGPACGGNLDLLIGFGVKKVIFCGGGGVLDKSIDVGKLMVVSGAIRDDGFSYHYLEPSRIVYTDKNVIKQIENSLDKENIDYFEGISWTTDAFFRETVDKVKIRKEEGAKIVEMEQAGCISASTYRKIKYGAIIYAGDDVSSSTWDGRNWGSRESIRYGLVNLCKKIAEEL